MNVKIQSHLAPIGTFNTPDGKAIQVYVTYEWRRPLEQLAALVNEQQAAIEVLQARLAAASIS